MGRLLRLLILISIGMILYGYFGYDELIELIGIVLAVSAFVALGTMDAEQQ